MCVCVSGNIMAACKKPWPRCSVKILLLDTFQGIPTFEITLVSVVIYFMIIFEHNHSDGAKIWWQE